jgi:hypothetical protein
MQRCPTPAEPSTQHHVGGLSLNAQGMPALQLHRVGFRTLVGEKPQLLNLALDYSKERPPRGVAPTKS